MAARSSGVMTVSTPSEKEIVYTGMFDAPRELVFKAHTDPELIPKWFGPRKYTTTVDKMEVRPGGEWRFLHRDEEGNEHAFSGEFREIVPPERIVWTFEWEALPGHVSVQTLTLEDVDGKTRITATSVFDSVEDRDGMLQGQEGAAESWERLAELLATM